MSIDFFIAKCQTENIVDKEFGICDDEDEEKKTHGIQIILMKLMKM